jgi:hypothetical protein
MYLIMFEIQVFSFAYHQKSRSSWSAMYFLDARHKNRESRNQPLTSVREFFNAYYIYLASLAYFY